MATQLQLDQIAEKHKLGNIEDFVSCKDASVNNPAIIIYKGYSKNYCQSCGGFVHYPQDWQHNRGLCVICCQEHSYAPETEKPKEPIIKRPKLKLNFNVKQF